MTRRRSKSRSSTRRRRGKGIWDTAKQFLLGKTAFQKAGRPILKSSLTYLGMPAASQVVDAYDTVTGGSIRSHDLQHRIQAQYRRGQFKPQVMGRKGGSIWSGVEN